MRRKHHDRRRACWRNGLIRPDSPEGKALGFTSRRFFGWLWKRDRCIILSAIISKQPGQGHLSMVLEAIQARGYRCEVPTPSTRMRNILSRKGFIPALVYSREYGEHVEVWRRGA